MSETIPVYFWLNTYSNADLGFWVLEDAKIPILPKSIDSLLHIRGKPGRYDFKPDIDSRDFRFKCAVKAQDSDAALQALFRTLAGILLNPNGSPRTVNLKFAMEPDKYYKVRMDGKITPTRFIYQRAGEFNLDFVAHDPFAYGSYRVFENTVTDNYVVVETIDNDSIGTLESLPRIVIKNNGSNTIQWVRLEILQKEG